MMEKQKEQEEEMDGDNPFFFTNKDYS